MIGIIILCGGSGKRLNQYLKTNIPKQFDKNLTCDNTSLFQKTIKIARKISSNAKILIIANKKHKYTLLAQAKETKTKECYIFLEPESKNTLPSLCLGSFAANKMKCQKIISMHSDHLISNEDEYVKIMQKSLMEIEAKSINLLGHRISIEQIHQFGLIAIEGQTYPEQELIKVKHFIEKPTEKQVRSLITNKRLQLYANNGSIVSSVSTILSSISIYCPRLFQTLKPTLKDWSYKKDTIFSLEKNIYANIEASSIDNNLLSKIKNLKCIPITLPLEDIGSFQNICKHPKLLQSSSKKIKRTNDKKSFVYNSRPDSEIVLYGTKNLIVLQNRNSTIIATNSKSKKQNLEISNYIKDFTHKTNSLQTEHRKWGYFEIITEGIGYKIKKLYVLPLHSTSLQLHNKRSEHIGILEGIAVIQLDNQNYALKKEEGIVIPKKTLHKIENPSQNKTLVILETQYGSEAEESDIKRF